MARSPLPLALTLLCLGATPAHAKEKPDSKQGLASQLVRLVTPRSAYIDSMDQMTKQMLPMLSAQTGQALPAGAEEKFVAALVEVLPYEEMMQWSAEIYAKHFTAGELRGLLAFYRTPVGKKMASKLPDIMGEVGKMTGRMLPQRMPLILQKSGLLAPPPSPSK